MAEEASFRLSEPLEIEKVVYGGDGLAHTPAEGVVFVPFTLPREIVAFTTGNETLRELRVLQASAQRVEPRCVHFGACGGCQYQMASYSAQLEIKEAILRETLDRAAVVDLPAMQIWGSPEEYGYRNRIRLRVRAVEGALRLGYSMRGTNDFLAVSMCPIAAPVFWAAGEALLQLTTKDRDAAEWVQSATEVELACDDTAATVQMHLLCAGGVPQRKGGLGRILQQLQAVGIAVRSLGASRLHAASGRPMEVLGTAGADGIAYRVSDDAFWLQRGSFFQVNRFLIPTLVTIVCGERRGELAWDLFAGAGLFSRPLARSFRAVTAVEASPATLTELRRGLSRPADHVVQETTLAFLRKAMVQRERPDLVVLDPPRAGAGEEACELLLRLRPAEIVYVSCDPTTLARDLQVLRAGYAVAEMHMVDLFPQTYHLETVMVLRRISVES